MATVRKIGDPQSAEMHVNALTNQSGTIQKHKEHMLLRPFSINRDLNLISHCLVQVHKWRLMAHIPMEDLKRSKDHPHRENRYRSTKTTFLPNTHNCRSRVAHLLQEPIRLLRCASDEIVFNMVSSALSALYKRTVERTKLKILPFTILDMKLLRDCLGYWICWIWLGW